MERRHKRLTLWQDAIDLVTQIYRITANYPEQEKFGLVSQMRRAAVSVASNIAEGSARNGDREFLRFLYIARGSLAELETQLEISKQLKLIEPETCINDVEKIFAKLANLIKTLKDRL
ncbi:MAG TPA: four helix bundle protein [Cellvibrionaceae bacterium]